MTNDLLQKNQYIVSFSKLPNTVIYLQKCIIPSISITNSLVPTPFSMLKEPDTKPTFAPYTMQFKLDENFDGYLDVFNWIIGLSFPNSFTEYSSLKGAVSREDRQNIFSDITITTLTNTNNSNVRIIFKDAFPTSISQVDLDTDVSDAVPIDVSATFEYHSFRIEKL